MIKTVGELKRILEDIDDDATIVLQIDDKEEKQVYIAMNDDMTSEYEESTNIFIMISSFTDICSYNE